MVFFVRTTVVVVVLLVVVVVFFVRIAVVLLVVELRRCKEKIFFFFFFFAVNVNRVLETRFTSRCHVKKMPTQTQLEHVNQALKARFTGPKSSL